MNVCTYKSSIAIHANTSVCTYIHVSIHTIQTNASIYIRVHSCIILIMCNVSIHINMYVNTYIHTFALIYTNLLI